MQINSINSTNFKAKIIPSQALSSALELAQEEAKSGREEGLKLAAKFYNSLRTIEKDRTAELFFVDATPVHFYPHMRLGRTTRLLEYFGNTPRDIAYSIISGVNKLVEGRYLRDQMADDAKNTDLTKAFLRWA